MSQMTQKAASRRSCALCGEPMHRYGFPADEQGHEPSATACVNTLRGRIESLETRLAESDAGLRARLRRNP